MASPGFEPEYRVGLIEHLGLWEAASHPEFTILILSTPIGSEQLISAVDAVEVGKVSRESGSQCIMCKPVVHCRYWIRGSRFEQDDHPGEQRCRGVKSERLLLIQ